jgi:bifunctional DNA-binding transcriptional regulator/antitoxin component of YhaV-PrlF toxin-antitoxin module
LIKKRFFSYNEKDKEMLMIPYVKRYLVSMSYTGRITIPKEIRENRKIKKGDIVYYKKRVPGYILMMPVKYAKDNGNLEKINLFLKAGLRNFFSETWGYTYVEENFRVFIDKSFRNFAQIEDCRRSSKKKVLLFWTRDKYVEIWSKELFDFLKSIYKISDLKKIDQAIKIYNDKYHKNNKKTRR